MFFPQLIAGPIVRYKDIESQIENRKCNSTKVAYGIKRFIYGLAKKVIISNTLAEVVDTILENDVNSQGTISLWIAIIFYAFQIYYDFSGYSDMAIGLGKMFGFDFLENFNYPYISQSIQEFWRRWHISLSTWFREYIYIPLGGNRKGKIRTYINLFIVFFTTGLWHGASFSFIFWGLWHGFFSILERLFLGKWLKNNKIKILNYIYVFLVVLVGWVFFRADTFMLALEYLKRMFIFTSESIELSLILNPKIFIIFIIAVLFSGFVQSTSKRLYTQLFNDNTISLIETFVITTLLFVSIMLLISNSYNPFIYFRF